MFNDNRLDLFSKILKKANLQQTNNEKLQDKASLPHNEEESHKKERRRELGATRWETEIKEEVLLKCQPTSDAA
jgi:hypothetical protein